MGFVVDEVVNPKGKHQWKLRLEIWIEQYFDV
jgi:hypothetical protein